MGLEVDVKMRFVVKRALQEIREESIDVLPF